MNLTKKISLFALLLSLLYGCKTEDLLPIETLRFNQIGFYPKEEKIAVFTGDVLVRDFNIRNLDKDTVVLSFLASDKRSSSFSDKQTQVLDFSKVIEPGKYCIEIAGIGKSTTFEIKHEALSDISKAAIKAFYYQRTATPIESEYAGKWSRESAHLDNQIIIHPSAASQTRPEGTVISSSKGWYDAGDYNKYIVNSGFTVGVLLSLYEDYPDKVNGLNTNIPESTNNTPDLLDEIHWNLDWMLTMQDPADGGVYHKLTNPEFEGFIPPAECKKQRYVVAKSVTAALDFAASMAQASRIFKSYEADYPDFADKALKAAEKAFGWAERYPDALYNQKELNKLYKPEIQTGEYGDRSAEDEFFWASSELYITTGQQKYLKSLKQFIPEKFVLPVWGRVASLGTFSLIRKHRQLNSPELKTLVDELENQLVEYASQALNGAVESPYLAPYGMKESDFFWGCNSDAASGQGITFLYAWKLTNDRTYLRNALRNMDYVLGKNATGYCYVTGFGTKSSLYPHHRLSATDNIDEPIPGLLIGGPNPGKQDGCTYPSEIADECYVDIVESYASNEIAINWQGLFSYFSTALNYSLE